MRIVVDNSSLEEAIRRIEQKRDCNNIYLYESIEPTVVNNRAYPSPSTIRLWDALTDLVRRSYNVREIQLQATVLFPQLYGKLLRAAKPICEELSLVDDDAEYDPDIPADTNELEAFIVRQPLINLILGVLPRAFPLIGTALRNALPQTTTLHRINFVDTELNETLLTDIREGMQTNKSVKEIEMSPDIIYSYPPLITAIKDRIAYNHARSLIHSIATNSAARTALHLPSYVVCVREALLRALATNTHVVELRVYGNDNSVIPPELYSNWSVVKVTVAISPSHSATVDTLLAFAERNRTRPWTPSTHFTFPPATRERIITGELVFARLNQGRDVKIPPEIRQMVWRFFTPSD